MFAYEEVIYQPAFYFLVAGTIVLSLAYRWGRRRNRRILTSALDPLIEIFHARDHQFTNIGGQTGFHANIVPGASESVRRVDVTVTLLPRHSLLYMPVSRLTRRYDRMYVTFEFNKKGRRIDEEAHLIEPRFEKRLGNRIENADSLQMTEIEWGGHTFRLYFASDRARGWIEDAMSRLGEPAEVRHVALVPQQARGYLFLIPRAGRVAATITTIRDWLDATASAAAAR